MVGRMRIGYLAVDVTHVGSLEVLRLPSFGTATPEIAAKVVASDGRTLALVLAPLSRADQRAGGWSRETEWRFEAACRKLAEHYASAVVLRWRPGDQSPRLVPQTAQTP